MLRRTDVIVLHPRGESRIRYTSPPKIEIAAITGHSLKEVGTILDAHYMHRDPALGKAAIRKLEERTVPPN